MNCQAIQIELSAYLDGEVPAQLRTEIEAHLAGCGACRHQLGELRQLAAGVKALPTLQPPPDFLRQVRHKLAASEASPTPGFWKLPAQVAALVAVLLTAVFLWRTPTPKPPEKEFAKESAAKKPAVPRPLGDASADSAAAGPAGPPASGAAPAVETSEKNDVATETIVVTVAEPSQVGEVRLRAAQVASRLEGKVIGGAKAEEMLIELPAEAVGAFRSEFALGDRRKLAFAKDKEREEDSPQSELPRVILRLQIVPPPSP